MTAPALAAAQEGARYQYRFFWRISLPMLYLDAPPRIEKVVMEHRGVDAVDDVVVYWTTPGLADAGRFVRIDFHQVKFHLAQGQCITAENLIDPMWTGTSRSMLWNFAASWKELREQQPDIRLSLVTNWPWCGTDPLAPLIRDTGKIHESFFKKGPSSKVGKVRTAWREHLSLLSDQDFNEFIERLRLCVRAVSQADAGEWLADRCQLAGLKRPDLATNHSPYDDLAGRVLADGRREFTRAELEALVQQEKLRLDTAVPFRSTCAIRTFRRFAHEPKTDAALVIDLTSLFEGRHPLDPNSWREMIPARLSSELTAISSLPPPVQIALDAHLSIGWYVGTLLDAKAGIPILLRQKSYSGVELWDTGTAISDPDQSWQLSTGSVGGGAEVAVAISITHDVAPEVRSTVAAVAPQVGILVNARLPQLGPAAIRGGAHACSLADELARGLRDIARKNKAHRTHVFAACPVSFAFLLGQRSAAIGPVTMYEYDFGGMGTYRPTIAT
jgi:hypothetical protein